MGDLTQKGIDTNMELGIATTVGLMLFIFAFFSNRELEKYQEEVQEKFDAFEDYILNLEKKVEALKFDIERRTPKDGLF